MFGRIRLHAFVKANPPQGERIPATAELLARHADRLPAALLELWRKHGFGLYGRRQISLIDPDLWQPVLDRWIVSPPDGALRVPIALTPFGTLLFYRRLTATDEDVATLNPVTRSSSVLSWDLAECFNRVLSDPAQVDEFIRPDMLEVAAREAGPLAPGEVYHVDPMLLSMQMLKITRADALALHRDLRAQVDREQMPPAPPAASIAAAMPASHRAAFAAFEADDAAAHPRGLFLSVYIDWRRLLAFDGEGRYRLLFWKNDHKTGEALEVRHYEGPYRVQQTAAGDRLLELDIALRRDSLGSDANDERLYLMRSGGQALLLKADSLEDMATAIGGRGSLGRSEDYFRAVRLGDPLPDEDSDGMAAPPFDDLPAALQALVHREPLRTTIVEVAADTGDADDETLMVRVDLGSSSGLRMNMPLMSPKGSGRDLYGWVWEMDEARCGVGIEVERDAAGRIVGGPQVGDVLVSRAD
ncbi:hypothetical protein M2165_000064 [Variovorax sp. TBS-050B]|uniref:GAD-like domain-containing protein n=1 Tax=Variovorax sp. TBS-050B TaxID=2940551 RepID=UPI00247338FA|nr:GAD-like domain-containing protein [Variovorax sp. TBS-050B]MDH6590175.1 hypothetical protein [Variovorax sp. TBS-050B]